MLVSRMGNLAASDLTGNKWIFDLDQEPFSEFAIVGERAPDAGYRSLEFNSFFDAISCFRHDTQPLGCIITGDWNKRNSTVANRQTLVRMSLSIPGQRPFPPASQSCSYCVPSQPLRQEF